MLRSTIGVISLKSGILRNNLVFYLDSTNTSSYIGSGSTWNDLSTSGLTTTLYNTPTYNNGILSFDDASLEYAETNSNHPDYNTWTVECWVRFNSSLSGKCTAVVTGQYDMGTKLNFSIGTNNFPSNSNIAVGFFNGAWRTTSGFTPSLSTWYHITGTYDGTTIRQYINGVANGGTLNYTGIPQSGGKIRIARRWDDVLSSTNLLDADIPIVRIYNKALGVDELLSNYNTDKSYFGL